MPQPAPDRRRRFGVLHLLLVAVFGATVGLLLGLSSLILPDREAVRLYQKFGVGRSSRNIEELVIRDFFGEKRDGVFLDVGCNHYQEHSNTYFLEKELGWSGIGVDALAEFKDGYEKHRPKTRYFTFFVSDVSDQSAGLWVSENHELSSGKREAAENEGQHAREIEVPTITLDALLERNGVEKVDFLSMDIELAEPKALAGFDVEKYRPLLACVEAHPAVRQQILDYFAAHHYTVVAKYLRADKQNLYFRPLP